MGFFLWLEGPSGGYYYFLVQPPWKDLQLEEAHDMENLPYENTDRMVTPISLLIIWGPLAYRPPQ